MKGKTTMSEHKILKTEMRNPNSTNIDRMTTAGMLECIQRENENAVLSVRNALGKIEIACDVIAEKLSKDGRLIYVGAGTSGRLGVLDASECPPTFGVPRSMVVGIIAGGEKCMFQSAEAEEDNYESGMRDLKDKLLTSDDVVVGIIKEYLATDACKNGFSLANALRVDMNADGNVSVITR